jgi:hypothetical protein
VCYVTLYREFVLDRKAVWPIIVNFVKANYNALIDAGKPLHIIVTTAEKKRNGEQNARLWGYIYATIADQAWVDGRRYSKDTWHEYFARKHCPKTEFVLPGGEIISRRKSTAEMNVGEFSEYMNAIEAEAAMELGVRFE